MCADADAFLPPATAQVPQMLLEEAWGSGRGARIMCTQPRRISAVSVAERIAQERGERIGDSVGYTIRLESKCVNQTLFLQRFSKLKEVAYAWHPRLRHGR